jgi:hypothetical protein
MKESLERHKLLPGPDAKVLEAQQRADDARRRREEISGMRMQGLLEIVAPKGTVARPSEVHDLVNIATQQVNIRL